MTIINHIDGRITEDGFEPGFDDYYSVEGHRRFSHDKYLQLIHDSFFVPHSYNEDETIILEVGIAFVNQFLSAEGLNESKGDMEMTFDHTVAESLVSTHPSITEEWVMRMWADMLSAFNRAVVDSKGCTPALLGDLLSSVEDYDFVNARISKIPGSEDYALLLYVTPTKFHGYYTERGRSITIHRALSEEYWPIFDIDGVLERLGSRGGVMGRLVESGEITHPIRLSGDELTSLGDVRGLFDGVGVNLELPFWMYTSHSYEFVGGDDDGWMKFWNTVVGTYSNDPRRMGRGHDLMEYVRISKAVRGEIIATVKGSKGNRYTVTVHGDDSSEVDWIRELPLDLLRSFSTLSLDDGFPRPWIKTPFVGMGFECTCPDKTTMCKHKIAVLYEIGDNPGLRSEFFGYDYDGELDRRVSSVQVGSDDRIGFKRVLSRTEVRRLFGKDWAYPGRVFRNDSPGLEGHVL